MSQDFCEKPEVIKAWWWIAQNEPSERFSEWDLENLFTMMALPKMEEGEDKMKAYWNAFSSSEGTMNWDAFKRGSMIENQDKPEEEIRGWFNTAD